MSSSGSMSKRAACLVSRCSEDFKLAECADACEPLTLDMRAHCVKNTWATGGGK